MPTKIFWEQLKKTAEEELSKYTPQEEPHIKWLNSNNINGCLHKWRYNGHGHNYSHYICTICGMTGEY